MVNSELEKRFIDACCDGTIEEVKKYLDEGVNINVNTPPARDGDDSYSLLVSVYYCNRVDILDLLFERGIDIEHRSLWGDTTLVIMCELKAYNYARDLIRRGANVNASDNNGHTALHWVADHTHSRGPIIPESQYRPRGHIEFEYYDPSEDIEFFKELVDWGADPYAIYNDRSTAMDLIKRHEHIQEIENYINRGKNIKGADS